MPVSWQTRFFCSSAISTLRWIVSSTLIPVTILIGTMTVLALVFLRVGQRVSQEQGAGFESSRAALLAEAGIAEAIEALRSGQSGDVGSAELPAYLGGGVLWVEATDLGDGRTQLDAMAMGVARALAKRGLERGDRVAILSMNRAEYIAAYFGIMRAGFVAVPVNYRFPRQIIHFIVGDCGPKLAFCDGARRADVPPGLPAVAFGGVGDEGFDTFLDPGPFEGVTPRPAEPAMTRLVLASGNAGKLAELRALHDGTGAELVAQSDLGVAEIEETGLTFVENALLKARHAARASERSAPSARTTS